MLILLPLFAFVTVFLIVVAIGVPQESEIQARLRVYGHTSAGGSGDLQQSFVARILWPIFQKAGERLSRLTPEQMQETIRLRLHQAGTPFGLTVSQFLVLRAIAAVAPATLLALLLLRQATPPTPLHLLALALAILFGWRIPDTWLAFRIDARALQIQRALPDAVDLIVVCVEAGHGLEAALQKVAASAKGPLAEELNRTLAEMALGARRREALRNLATRVGVNDLQTFVASILQADQMGVSIGQALRVQADSMRIRRRQLASEQAAKVPVKMLFPMIGMIFPAMFIVILGPVLMKLMGFFHTISMPR